MPSRVIDYDDSWIDQPYTAADLLKPGFDPFEAHRAWIARRLAITPQDEARMRQATLVRIKAEQVAFKKHQKRRRKIRKLTEAQLSLKLWKDALGAVKRKRS
jgi:hypothetical protein